MVEEKKCQLWRMVLKEQKKKIQEGVQGGSVFTRVQRKRLCCLVVRKMGSEVRQTLVNFLPLQPTSGMLLNKTLDFSKHTFLYL